MPLNDKPTWTEIGAVTLLASVMCSTGPAMIANWIGSSVIDTVICNSLQPSLYIAYRGIGTKFGFFSQNKVTPMPPPLKLPSFKEAKEIFFFLELLGINSKLFLNILTAKELTTELESIIATTGFGVPITIGMLMLVSHLACCINRTRVQPQESNRASLRF